MKRTGGAKQWTVIMLVWLSVVVLAGNLFADEESLILTNFQKLCRLADLQLATEAFQKEHPNPPSGRVVLVDFWATTCPPCVREFPAMKELYTRYRTNGFEIVGVSLD